MTQPTDNSTADINLLRVISGHSEGKISSLNAEIDFHISKAKKLAAELTSILLIDRITKTSSEE